MSSDPYHQVDLRRIRTVLEVARAGSITTAAQTLRQTQPGVSRAVSEVEDALGQTLFNRSPRGIEITEAGRLFVARARSVLAAMDDLVSMRAVSPHQLTGHLRIGVAAAGWPASTAFVDFAHAFPEVVLETVHAPDQSLCPRLLSGELDLVVGSSTNLTRWKELAVTPLAPLYCACMMRRDHPLSQLEQVTEADLLSYPLLLPESVEATYSDIAYRYYANGLPEPKPRYVTGNPDLVMKLLNATDAFLPFVHPAPDFGDFGAHYLLLRDVLQRAPHDISFARVANKPSTPAVAALEEILLASFS